MCVAMAVDAGGGRSLIRAGLPRVNTVRIWSLRAGMALLAGDFRGRRFVRQALYVGMTVDAVEQPRVDRVLQFGLIDVEADGFAVLVGGQRGVTVTGKAVGVFELLGGDRMSGREQKDKSERGCKQPSSRVHGLRRTLYGLRRSGPCHIER